MMNKKVKEQLQVVPNIEFILKDGAVCGLDELDKKCAQNNEKYISVRVKNRNGQGGLAVRKRPTIGVRNDNK